MVEAVTSEQVREAAAGRIFARRDELLREQRSVKQQQAILAERDREIDRELAECKAAARFFELSFELPPEDQEIAQLRVRFEHYQNRSAEMRARGQVREAEAYGARAEVYKARLREAEVQRARSANQGSLTIAEALPESAPAEAPPAAPPTIANPKMPKVRDIVLDQLRAAGAKGQKAAPIQQYIESTYSVELHDKTVGMTLYRLSKEQLVHRKGQTWFYGPQAGHLPPMSPENPGVDAPGPTQSAG